ncbi:MAG TPA: DUF1080 domain-containing protein, partial [Pirellulales bacterium]
LLNEIAAARVCLLNTVKKDEYDRQLRAKESGSAQATAATPSERVLRPIKPPTSPAPVATAAPPVSAWQPPPAGPAPTPVPRARPPESVLLPVNPAPISLGPVARRPPTKIHFRKPARQRSEAHKTLFLAAGLAAIVIALFVVYKTRSGASGKATHDVASANRLVQDDTEKAREAGKPTGASGSSAVVTGTVVATNETPARDETAASAGPSRALQPPSQVVIEPTLEASSIWEKLTRQLNDLSSWTIASGQWSQNEGRLYGQGESRLQFQEKLPEAFLLSFEMKVVDGMRPRIFLGDHFHFGNEGYDRTLFVHDGVQPPIIGAPRPYSTGAALKIACRVSGEEVEFLVDGKLVAGCRWERPSPMKLTLSAGDFWSKGQVLFGPFTLGPSPSKPLAAFPPETPIRSIDKPAPEPATPPTAASGGGWRDLFDGKSLVGWTGDVGLMTVENGVLVNAGKRGIAVAPGEYRDVELELEFRLANGGNSGLVICYSGDGDPSQNGLEVQMLDDTANRRLQGVQRCGAVYGLAAAKPGHFKRWPAWNRLRVTSVDDNVRVQLNSTLVTDATRSLMKRANPQHAGVARTSGKVCLFPIQGRSEYRSIRIRSAE